MLCSNTLACHWITKESKDYVTFHVDIDGDRPFWIVLAGGVFVLAAVVACARISPVFNRQLRILHEKKKKITE